MQVKVKIDGIDKAIKAIKVYEHAKAKAVKDAINEAALNVQRGAKSRCAVDTGRLRSSITIEPQNNGFTLQVGTNVKYAAAVEFGTAPHTITPKNKKALYWPGAAHPVKSVEHPGTAAKPFLFPAWEEERPKLLQTISEVLKDV